MRRFKDGIDAFDRFQQRHPIVGFPLAVQRKYSQDQGGYLAATIAYYGFFSIFPLLLVLVTSLGYVLRGHPHLEQRIIASTLGQFPIVGGELQHRSLKGNGVALAIGVATSLWTGMGVLLAAESAMSQLWNAPYARRLSFLASRLRALALLALLGGGVLVTTVLSGAGTAGGGRLGIALRIAVIAVSLLADFLLLWLAFRLLSPTGVGWTSLRGGAAAAAVGYEALQLLGSYYVSHTLKHASNVYGTFALVIGLLSWIYLTATVVLVASEGNVVAARRLWPRPLRQEGGPGTSPARREPSGGGEDGGRATSASSAAVEGFQQLQLELLRAGFETELQAEPGDDAVVVVLFVELGGHTAAEIETLLALGASRGFLSRIEAGGRAAITSAPAGP